MGAWHIAVIILALVGLCVAVYLELNNQRRPDRQV